MHRNLTTTAIVAILALTWTTVSAAGPREEQLAQYAAAAKAANPAFASFSTERGKTLHTQTFAGGKPDTPACASCHGKDPRTAGRSPAGKTIDPMALSTTPSRYTDPAKVEKWFKRNCTEVMGRECTAAEKADFIQFAIEGGRV